MSRIDNIVQVNVDFKNTNPQAENFKLPALIGLETEFPVAFTERYRVYNNISSLIEDGFETTSNIYKLANALLSSKRIYEFLIVKKLTAETYTSCINSLKTENEDKFYGLAITSRTKADIIEVSALCETLGKIFICASKDADIITNATDDLASLLENTKEKTMLIYHTNADVEFIDGACLGDLLGSEIGTFSSAFKSYDLINADILTDNEIANLRSKKANFYTKVADIKCLQDGQNTKGTSIAIVRDINVFKRTLQLGELSVFFNNDVINYDNTGLLKIETAIKQTCLSMLEKGVLKYQTKAQIAEGMGILEKDVLYYDIRGFYLKVPSMTETTSYNATTKTLSDIQFVGKVRDEILKLIINLKI